METHFFFFNDFPLNLNPSNREWYLSIIVTVGQGLEVELDVHLSKWRKLSFTASQSFGAQPSCSPDLPPIIDTMELVPWIVKIASYSQHQSVVTLSNDLFPAPSTPFTVSEKDKNSKLSSLLFAIILAVTFALTALRKINANSCVWAMIYWLIWECPILFRLATTSIIISKKIGIDKSSTFSNPGGKKKQCSIF